MRWFLLLLFMFLLGPVTADVVHLKSGGKIEGEVIEDGWRVRVKLPDGSIVEFKPDDVLKIEYDALSPAEEFEKRLSEIPKDDAEAFYRLAKWCKSKGLKKEMRECLEKAIELEPDHTGARTMLGYVRHKGKWVLFEDMMSEKGLVKYKGRWMTPAERDKLLFKEREKKWRGKIMKLVKKIGGVDEEEAKKATESYRNIKDEAALKWVLAQLNHKSKKLRLLTIEVLCNFDVSRVGDALIETALKDDDEEVRKEAATALRRLRCRWAYVRFFEAMFYNRSADVRGNAVDALGTLKDKNSIPPLIESLIIKVRGVEAASGREFFVGSVARRVIGYKEIVDRFGNRIRVPIIASVVSGVGSSPFGTGESFETNYQAREALRQITGRDFNYDQDEWREWWKENSKKFDDFMNPIKEEK